MSLLRRGDTPSTKEPPQLKSISDTAQQVAEAVSAVLDVETEILDDQYNIVAGTGKYKNLIGTKDDEAWHTDGDFIYTRVLKTGDPIIIEDPEAEFYGPILMGEMGEICCPIKLRGKVIGVLSLVAFDEKQKNQLMDKKDQLLNFLNRMAFLLASRVSEVEAYNRLEITSNKLNVIIETINQGIISINRDNIIIHCNKYAESIIGIPSKHLLGLHIEEIWPDSPAVKVTKTGVGYREKEELCGTPPNQMHLLVTATPVWLEEKPMGAVISFRNMSDARQMAYNLTDNKIALELDHIKGNSKKIREVKYQALRVAKGSSTILITGESGTGKELFARAIHYTSPRRNKPLVIVNCGAIPETLLESELFGYEEGAFTGARKGGRPGKFELANEGTIFLDEIGDLPLHLQVKLLHAIQRRQVERVGGNHPIPVDVRIVAATNRDLEAMCRTGEFREDLFYRLNVIPLFIPPLRNRKEDIAILMDYFLDKYRDLLGKIIDAFSENARQAFIQYEWPGNVRELENAVEYAVNMEPGRIITLESIPKRVSGHWLNNGTPPAETNFKDDLGNMEKDLLAAKIMELSSHNYSKKEIATALGISRATLYRKIKQYGIKL
ncbi:PAS domain S-box-containing protein [Desulfotomaculum arcticum]|uniref:PAS domain S-box-containing protein n=1 Tax=Desulfotruncus arcticus DSM 17038 TaxID=1121424 RepID=A0A1I2WY06_9FIRM|nr:sigma 54-interacting transcriptional regulator [Desulfotruncus arcticus]SFH06155.1 PAS domain S-box-containing protein [Desulfotomaculum arcticum] [Desulfotruncus arcticus DSM 17038]